MSVLLIHPSLDMAETIKTQLSDTAWHVCDSLKEAEAYIVEHKPELIVCHRQLSDGSAFDFTTRIRLISDNKLTPIIIVADAFSAKERVMSFQVGADEYVAPVELDFLHAAIDHELTNFRELLAIEQEKQTASAMVLEAMRSSSEMGNAIQFIERCHRFDSVDTVANELIRFCQNLNLNVVVGVVLDDRWQFWATAGTASTLEQDLIQAVHAKDRFVDFGVRTQMNWPNIALLVKNMPLRDPEKYGRFKDLLPTLMASANVRIHTLYETQRIQEQTELMARSVETLQPAITRVIEGIEQNNSSHRHTLSTFFQQLIVALPGLGLDEDQEDFFVSKFEHLISEVDNMIKDSVDQQETLHMTNRVLSNLMDKQKELDALRQQTIEIADEKSQNDDADLFELF